MRVNCVVNLTNFHYKVSTWMGGSTTGLSGRFSSFKKVPLSKKGWALLDNSRTWFSLHQPCYANFWRFWKWCCFYYFLSVWSWFLLAVVFSWKNRCHMMWWHCCYCRLEKGLPNWKTFGENVKMGSLPSPFQWTAIPASVSIPIR